MPTFKVFASTKLANSFVIAINVYKAYKEVDKAYCEILRIGVLFADLHYQNNKMLIRTEGNILFMSGIIWSGDDTYFDYHFSKLEKEFPSEVKIYLHTKGGEVFAGSFIESRIRASKAKTIIRVLGTAFSMGSILLTAADEREMVANGFVMIHEPKGRTLGNAQAHTNAAQLLTDMESNFVASLMSITNKTKKQVEKWLIGDNYFNAKRALKEGIIDRIVDPVLAVAIDETKALDASEVYGQFSALLVDKQTRENSNKNKDKMKQQLIDKFGLTDVTASSSDTAIAEALQNHFDAQVTEIQAKLDKEVTKSAGYETAITAQRDAKIEALLKPLEGKLSKEKLATYKAIGENDVKALETVLEGINPRNTMRDAITDGDGTAVVGREAWDWDKWQKEDPRGVEKMAQDSPEAFLALGKAKFGNNWTI